MKRTLLLGIGNTIRGDDGVGIFTARALKKEIHYTNIHIMGTQEICINLLDIIADYEKVIIIDSIRTGHKEPGYIYRFASLESNLMGFAKDRFGTFIEPYSSHQIGLATIINMANNFYIHMPKDITIFAIEIENGDFFSDTLTPKIRASIPELVNIIKQELFIK
ncbi:MAG: hypothetical protein C4B57_08045 [Deltaproteobacteria bacterium]|nr:MAG: hypothetical protein C4B57_08045 [Deltaproteobacteria bacterium]